MAPPQSPFIASIPNLTGPLALGYMFGCGLFGMLIVQMSVYVSHFPKDNRRIKLLVWTVFVCEAVFTFFTAIAAWNNFGKNWGDVETLLIIDWSWDPLPILNALVASMVQIFFAWRIYRLSNKIWISIPIVLVSLVQLCAATYYDAMVIKEKNSISTLLALTEWVDTWLISSAVCDILISTAMITILARASLTSHFRRSSSSLNQIIKFTIETGFITAIGAIIEIILWRTMSENSFHFIFFLTLGRLYSNVLLASLNSRATLSARHGGYIDVSASQNRSVLWSDMTSTLAGSRAAKSAPATINVQTTKIVHQDTELDDISKHNGTSSLSKPAATEFV
ncbi:hypothetical protein BDN71DRAFT_1449836 [Pleurotus eryngii]|uniref:DUF6534 domain-containing protein n=1 Tax=Pleurotus eryngii TaxID=5323 RepID=A0A9P6DE94_PLEER|nr:hypothetical protein BDN71DRAFT_1449836 [Pleurotus eryngii]